MRRRKRGKESPGQTPLKVENTKFKTRRTGSLDGETSRRRRRTRRHSPKRRSFSLNDNVKLDVNFEKAIEQAKTKPPKETNICSADEEEVYDTASLLPDMPSESDSANSEGSDFLEKKPQHPLRTNMRSQWYFRCIEKYNSKYT